jgi:hypothetical protein
MASRRDVLMGGGSGLAALGLGLAPGAIAAGARPPPRVAPLFLIDVTIASEVGRAAVRSGNPAVRYAGDVGVPWMERIEPLWRSGPQPLAGVTYGGAFFCLEHLARTYGLVCAYRACPPLAASGALGDTDADKVVTALLRSAEPGAGLNRGHGPARGEAGDRPLAWLLRPAVKR